MATTKNGALLAIANAAAQEIEEIVWDKDVSYLEAALIWCETRGQSEEDLGGILKYHERLRSLIEIEAEELNFLKKKPRLPI